MRATGPGGEVELTETRYESHGAVALVTLARPECLNALTARTLEEIGHLVDRAGDDDAVGSVVLTGGPRSDGRPFANLTMPTSSAS